MGNTRQIASFCGVMLTGGASVGLGVYAGNFMLECGAASKWVLMGVALWSLWSGTGAIVWALLIRSRCGDE